MSRKFKILLPLISVVILASKAAIGGDLYTAVSGMEWMLETELHFVENFENYMREVNETNNFIKGFLDDVESDLEEIEEDVEYFFENPLNAFMLLKRIAIGWKRLENIIMANRDGDRFMQNVSRTESLGYPKAGPDDLKGASSGILLLQTVYQLSAHDIANGILQDYMYEPKLSASDCFELGRVFYEIGDYARATEWLLQTRLQLAQQTVNDRSATYAAVNEVQILEYLAPTVYNNGNAKLALVFNNELLRLDPDNAYALQNQDLYASQRGELRVLPYEFKSVEPPAAQKSEVTELYEKVCRGELHQTPSEQRELRCRYFTNDIPYRLIGPFKMEELNHDPFVAVYHDMLLFDEMDKIINTTENYIQRSKVGDVSVSQYSEIRTSKNTWLYYHEHDFLTSIGQRLMDLTNLSLDSAEPLQVANYGLGGHYGPHYDFSEDPDNTYQGQGNRILTALFYINEIELGGATAFPFLRIAVPPERGSLLVWYNMHESLELDYRTKHAGCPVLKGSKWICNQWFHQIGQEFIRPCSLEMMGNISLPYRNIA